MKLKDYYSVKSHMEILLDLKEKLKLVETAPNALGVTIQGTYQKEDVVDAVRPIVMEALKVRIKKEEAALSKYGINIEEEATV